MVLDCVLLTICAFVMGFNTCLLMVEIIPETENDKEDEE